MMNSIIFSSLFQKNETKKKPSLFIDLPKDLVPLGLIDFCLRLGFESNETDFDLFQPANQSYTMKFLQYTRTFISQDDSTFIIYYESESALSTLLSAIASEGMVDTKTDSPLTYYENLSHLWSAYGTGEKDEAHPQQHISVKMDIQEDLKTNALLKEVCYLALRLGLYATSISLPAITTEERHVTISFKNENESYMKLTAKNAIQISGTKDILPAVVHSIATAKHVSEGGLLGVWEFNEKQVNEAAILLEEQWSDKSEASYMIKALEEEIDKAFEAEIYMTANKKNRDQFKLDLYEKFSNLTTIKVRSAFKTGLYWILEEVLPSVGRRFQKVKIVCKDGVSVDGLEQHNRWIMELYPVDEMIEMQYGIPKEHVQFELSSAQQHVYRVFVDDQLIAELNPLISEVDYVDGQKKAYPTTAGYRLFNKTEQVQENIIFSDRERFYKYYVKELLPRMVKKLKIDTNNINQGQLFPLFDRIEIDFTSSGIEEEIGVQQEANSSFEALYEDLYFNTLDYFHELGRQLVNQPYKAPGGVIPYIHIEQDLYKPIKSDIKVYQWNDKPMTEPVTKRILFNQEGQFETVEMSIGNELKVTEARTFLKHNMKNLVSLVERFKQYSEVKLNYGDISYKGTVIPFFEVTEPITSEYYSGLKKSDEKHTIVFEAGHHPNEVSSTPAILELMEDIVCHYPEILKKINIIIIPLSNPDGYEIMESLTKEHPKWKHHAARFNAVGLEFAHVKFKKSVFGEANVLPLILKKWAPDVIIDDHGIPAREWVQPFAGYACPPIFPVSYTIPSAKIYGIGRYANNETKEVQARNLELVAERVNKIFEGSTFAQENAYWRNRYYKYGTKWDPEKYPIEEMGNINFYRSMEVTPAYSSVSILRYPQWVALDIISEVADEIVYDEELISCVKAHKLFNQAIIEATLSTPVDKNNQSGRYIKKRPIEIR
ncbi:M14 family metallopeptidase [Lysinibacillus irui]|uniref:M14 family metallopeptidase n=2 Tax=Lysinibacillus irui TaxID=2998077 RepID=A0ABU5NMZ9_9BACI|nr:M14 family metallopeptidase [Lysinibacillus irui]MEA0552296.1 M14 family metallopeptidase [Lysinibacillus irui]MEA0977428.1 M14 family metallopeptidase [Lysinibacillus irui]MEA1043582.1 M14 family metallopeptidase [Lysinibacillus irui]